MNTAKGMPRFTVSQPLNEKCARIGKVKEPRHQTIIRHSDEPKLEIGDVVQIKEGVAGVAVGRYTRYTASGDESQDENEWGVALPRPGPRVIVVFEACAWHRRGP